VPGQVCHQPPCHLLPVVQDWGRLVYCRNFHFCYFLLTFKQLCDVRALFFKKLEFQFCYRAVRAVVQDLKNKLLGDQSLVYFGLGRYRCLSLGLGSLLLLLLVDWRGGPVFDEELLDIGLIVPYRKIDWSLSPGVCIIDIDVVGQQVL